MERGRLSHTQRHRVDRKTSLPLPFASQITNHLKPLYILSQITNKQRTPKGRILTTKTREEKISLLSQIHGVSYRICVAGSPSSPLPIQIFFLHYSPFLDRLSLSPFSFTFFSFSSILQSKCQYFGRFVFVYGMPNNVQCSFLDLQDYFLV